MADLYHIHEPDDETDHSLLVRGGSPEEAVKIWIAYYEFSDDEIELIGDVAVFLCMADLQETGAIAWGEPTGMFEVGRKKVKDWI